MNKWDQRYSSESFVYGTEPNNFLKEHACRIPPGPCLSLADGEGRNGVYLATLGHPVTAVDASAVGLKKAHKLAKLKGVSIETRHCDLADYIIPVESFSGIVSIFCHLPPELRRSTYQQAVQALRPGGIFILEGYSRNQLGRGTGGPSIPELLLSIEELKEDLRGLDFLIAHEIEREILEGTHHTGLASVAQVVAQKSKPLSPDEPASSLQKNSSPFCGKHNPFK